MVLIVRFGVLLVIILFVVLACTQLFARPRDQRRRLFSAPFPAQWLVYLSHNCPFYQHLSAADQAELRGHMQVFLAEKSFEGCRGLTITDDIRVTIAAHACLLLLHRDTDYYPKLSSILVYPAAYLVPTSEKLAGGVVTESEQVILGQSFDSGVVVLAWDQVLEDAVNLHDGHNLVLHEFAHQLDLENGKTDGLPILSSPESHAAWTRVIDAEYKRLRRKRSSSMVLNEYGATNKAEFFAVATEAFFETPHQLQKHHPALYAELQQFYQQDPQSYLFYR